MLKNQDRVCISPRDLGLGFFILQKVVDFAFDLQEISSVFRWFARTIFQTDVDERRPATHQDGKMKRRLFSTLHRLQHENPLVVLPILISKPD